MVDSLASSYGPPNQIHRRCDGDVGLCKARKRFRSRDGAAVQHGWIRRPRAQSTRAFVRNLAQHTDLPVLFWDERLSSFAAESAMLEADLTRNKRAKVIDQMAASIILQGALDAPRKTQV